MKLGTCLLALSIAVFLSCGKEEKSVLDGCCGNPAIDAPVGDGHVYLPNIFTPNNDGHNDRLTILGDDLKRVVFIEIRDRNGVIVFNQANFSHTSFLLSWDGKVNGIAQKGLYSVTLSVEANDGTTRIFNGEVCNYPCEFEVTEGDPISISTCQFPSQSNQGQYDATFPSGEHPDCLE